MTNSYSNFQKAQGTTFVSRKVKLPEPRWHKKLDPVKSIATHDNIIISKQHVNKDGSEGCSYATYPLFHLPDYILSLPDPDRNFFEYLRGPRKPYFDCELERDTGITPQDITQYDTCIERLLQNMSDALTSRGYNYHYNSNLIRQSSHNETKLSNHFIIDRYCFPDALSAKSFYHECIKNIPPEILYYINHNGQRKCIVDGSVYTERPFRLPFCTKINKNRPLIPDPLSTYVPGPLDADAILTANHKEKDNILKKWYILHSMICYTADCTMLPSFKSVNDVTRNVKVVTDAMMNTYIDCYNRHPEINTKYDINQSLSKNYLYLQRKGIVTCPISEHGEHKHNHSKICTDYDNKIVFKCFSHTGRIILGSDVEHSDDDDDDDDDADVDVIVGGFNMRTGTYDKVKEYEASFNRNATPEDVVFFINSLEKVLSPNFTIDSKPLRQQFTKYCDKNKLESWFKQKAFDNLLLASEDIVTAKGTDGNVFIVGYTLNNVDTIVRPDLPENLRPRQRQQAQPIIANGTLLLTNATTMSAPNTLPTVATIPKVFVKRPATTDDVKYFIDSLCCKDITKSVTCPELCTAFNNYCDRSDLYTSVTNRKFTDFIVKSGRYNTAVNRKSCRTVIGISLANVDKITRRDHMFEPTEKVGTTSTAGRSHPNTNYLLNNISKINTSDNIDGPFDVPLVDKSDTSNTNNVPAVELQGTVTNEPPKMFDESMLRDFWDAEMIAVPDCKLNILTFYHSFKLWCKENKVHSPYKSRGLSRLVTSRFGLERTESHGISYIHGWNVRRTISNEEHIKKENALRRIFTQWTDRYEIGRHNGPYPHYHLGSSRWANIHVKHEYVHTKGTNGRILLPGIETMSEIPGRDNERDGFILAIKADMAAGKTEGIKPYIEANPNMRVIYVVPVISLANKMLNDLTELGFNIYSDEAVNSGAVIEGNRICTTYNSLYKVVGHYDMIAFDEYRLIQKMQFAPILKKKAECYRAFCYRLQTTPKVIVADALLENKHVLQLKDISSRSVTVYQCMNKIHEDKDLTVIDGDMYAINSIITAVTRGERVAVPTGGAKYARFIKEKLLEINPDLNIGLYTKDEMKTIDVDVTTLWDEHTNIIIYTPTILAGASYLGEVDAIYAIFLTNTCCPDAAAQMMLRCRKARKYYVCVKDTHLRKIRIGEDLYPSYSNTLMWLDNRERLYKTASEEEDVLHAGLVLGTGELEQNYMQLYASYCQDEEKARKHYLFYLIIYLRDMGFKFSGLKSAISDEDKEAVNQTKGEYGEYTDKCNNAYWNAKADAPEITAEEYIEIDKKPNKTPEDVNKSDKYLVMYRYDVPAEVITAAVMKQAKGNDRKHDNLRTYQKLSGIEDDNVVEREINNIYLTCLPTRLKALLPMRSSEERPLRELTANIIDGSPPIDSIAKEYLNMSETEYKENMLCCSHSVKILRLLGNKDFMRLYANEHKEDVDQKFIKSYIDNNWEEITTITRLSTKKHEAYTDRQGNYHGNYVDKAAAKLLDKAFGMSYGTSELDGGSISRGTFKKVNGKIILSKMDSTKIPPSREFIQETFRHNVLNRTINTPQNGALVLNVIRSSDEKWWERPCGSTTIKPTVITCDSRRKNMPNNYNPMIDGPLIQLHINKV